ncbi:hypothetical protein GR247_27915 [Rhizobium leguminosarum]|nr:hypothetical protein [Rhizobium leguminosarum]NKK60660.1 hypothetical protein [Rhizobium leguminosarum bv. viciae]
MRAAMNPERRSSPVGDEFAEVVGGRIVEDIRHLRQQLALAEGALRRGCHIRRAPRQVALKPLGFTAKEQQAATNRALENKAEVLSQVLPTSRELKFIGRTTCDRENRLLRRAYQIRRPARESLGIALGRSAAFHFTIPDFDPKIRFVSLHFRLRQLSRQTGKVGRLSGRCC